MNEEKIQRNWKEDNRKSVPQWAKAIDKQAIAVAAGDDVQASERNIAEMKQNALLAGLSPIDRERIAQCSELVPLAAGQVLNDAVHQGRYVYFPISGSIALIVVLADGVSLEVASVGRYGMTGFAAAEGGERQMSQALVKSAGVAYRMKLGVWQSECSRSASLQQALLMYSQTLMSQLIQIAVCNRHHSVQQRFARWLLMTFDHAYPCRDLMVTQEFIATLLGVRREGITGAAGKLQLDSAIRYTRGKVTMLDRAVLEECACECYAAIREGQHEHEPLCRQGQSSVLPAALAARNRSGYAN